MPQESRRATQQIVDFACATGHQAIPTHVRQIGLDLLIDTIGCALAGYGVAKGQLALRAAADFGRSDDVTIIVFAKLAAST
jgi:2-methylcitrate dehydratase PrpD